MALNRTERTEGNADAEKKVGIGVLDIVVLLVLLAAAAALVLRYTTDLIHFGDTRTDCGIAFTVTGIRYTTYDVLENGETVFTEDGKALGTLNSITATPAAFLVTEADGSVIEAHYPENTLIDLSGEIVGRLVDRSGRFVTSGGTHISAGVRMTLRTRTADLDVLVTDVYVLPAE